MDCQGHLGDLGSQDAKEMKDRLECQVSTFTNVFEIIIVGSKYITVTNN